MQGRSARRGLGVVVADQQERGDGGEFPTRVKEQHVVGEHQAEHRPAEQHEQSAQAPHPCAVAEVSRGVQEHQDPDAGHEQNHQRGECIQAQVDVQAQRGDPLDVLCDRRRIVAENRTDLCPKPRQHGERAGQRQVEAAPSDSVAGNDDAEPADEVKRQQRRHDGPLP